MAIKGYWRFNGNSNDASGNGYNGTDTAVTYSQSTGKLGQGAAFNGSTSKIATPTIAWGSPTKITISLMVYPTSATTDVIFESSANANSNADSFNLAWVANKFALTSVGAVSPSVRYSSYSFGSGLALNKWYHVVCIIDKTTATGTPKVKMFINGVKMTGTADTENENSSVRTIANYPLYFGQRNGNVAPFHGYIDELKASNTEWSAAQAKNEYSRINGFF